MNLDNLHIKLTQVDGKSPMGVDVALDVRQGGQISLQGTVNPQEPSLESKIDVAAIDLRPLQPYIDTYTGAFAAFRYFLHPGNPALWYSARTGSKISYEGGFDLRQLQTHRTPVQGNLARAGRASRHPS